MSIYMYKILYYSFIISYNLLGMFFIISYILMAIQSFNQFITELDNTHTINKPDASDASDASDDSDDSDDSDESGYTSKPKDEPSKPEVYSPTLPYSDLYGSDDSSEADAEPSELQIACPRPPNNDWYPYPPGPYDSPIPPYEDGWYQHSPSDDDKIEDPYAPTYISDRHLSKIDRYLLTKLRHTERVLQSISTECCEHNLIDLIYQPKYCNRY